MPSLIYFSLSVYSPALFFCYILFSIDTAKIGLCDNHYSGFADLLGMLLITFQCYVLE